MNAFLDKVFNGDSLDLLRAMPTASVDAVITDAMYGTAKKFTYDWGPEPAKGDPAIHWLYHRPIYEECLRVLKPGGVLAWGQGCRFLGRMGGWFGPHRVWSLVRWEVDGLMAIGNVWIVQTRERLAVDFPAKDSVVIVDRAEFLRLKAHHPCPKPVEEMEFLIVALTKPGQVVLDCFCGVGSTLVAARRLGRHGIGCDKSRTYCQVAMKRLADLVKNGVA